MSEKGNVFRLPCSSKKCSGWVESATIDELHAMAYRAGWWFRGSNHLCPRCQESGEGGSELYQLREQVAHLQYREDFWINETRLQYEKIQELSEGIRKARRKLKVSMEEGERLRNDILLKEGGEG